MNILRRGALAARRPAFRTFAPAAVNPRHPDPCARRRPRLAVGTNVVGSISAFAALRQVLTFTDGTKRDEIPYVVSGELAGSGFGSVRFSQAGTLRMPQ